MATIDSETYKVKATIKAVILLPFFVLPLIGTSIFFISYNSFKEQSEIVDWNLALTFGVLGVLGVWTGLIALFRGKKITIEGDTMTISRIFTGRKHVLKKSDITEYSITKLSATGLGFNYKVLMFKTKSNMVHSVVSYELTRFNDISKWVENSNGKASYISLMSFFSSEYLQALLVSILVIGYFVFDLKIRF